MQTSTISGQITNQNSGQPPKEPHLDGLKENTIKTKSGFSKKGQTALNDGTKVESTTNSTKKLIFSFKKDSKVGLKGPTSTTNKNNVLVKHRRVQSHGQAQQFQLAIKDQPTKKVHSPKPDLKQTDANSSLKMVTGTPQAPYLMHPATKLKQY